MKALAFALALLSAVATWHIPAIAASDCILDNCADRRSMVPQRQSGSGHTDRDFRRNGYGPRGASVSGSFDFYVLSLSWSPGFCATGGDEKGRDQCRSGADLGLHGSRPLAAVRSRLPVRLQRDVLASRLAPHWHPRLASIPDEGLARYEWRKHGACSGLSPNDYFAAAKAARDAVVVPPLLKEPHEASNMAPLDVEHAFTEANPRLRPGMLAAVCKDGTMDEVRICFTKDLKAFQVCPEVVRQRCRSASMAIPPVR